MSLFPAPPVPGDLIYAYDPTTKYVLLRKGPNLEEAQRCLRCGDLTFDMETKDFRCLNCDQRFFSAVGDEHMFKKKFRRVRL